MTHFTIVSWWWHKNLGGEGREVEGEGGRGQRGREREGGVQRNQNLMPLTFKTGTSRSRRSDLNYKLNLPSSSEFFTVSLAATTCNATDQGWALAFPVLQLTH